ncbi:hypothetical protein [Nocardia coubleae]|uniref:PPE family protein n=1 Tax=Nocardia coubleae TaxID=356147 RepID=A0A846W9U3_9NOCA|nr:hypothetical protein [Nocardia coubleae]NKX90202.1 hypothetical protein [Nocardia coubleae]
MPGGGENVHHWRHREITETFSSLDVTDAVAQADTFQQLARYWEEGLDAFDRAISVGLPAAWSGAGAEAAMSSVRRYLDQARELLSAVHVIPALVQAAADAVVATKYAIPEFVEKSAMSVWSTDPGGMREVGIREEEARAAMRDRYVRPFGEIFSRIPLIPQPIPPYATTGNGGPLGNDLSVPLLVDVVPGAEHYRPIGTDPTMDANVQRTCDESCGLAASSGRDVEWSAVTGAVPGSLADLPATGTRRFDANLDSASGAVTGIRIGAGGGGTAGALDVGAATVDVMRVGESPGLNADGPQQSDDAERGRNRSEGGVASARGAETAGPSTGPAVSSAGFRGEARNGSATTSGPGARTDAGEGVTQRVDSARATRSGGGGPMESSGNHHGGGPNLSSGQRGAGQANTATDSPGAAARNTFADRIALVDTALSANDALAGNAVAADNAPADDALRANNAPTGNVLAADKALAGNAPTADDAGVETRASGAGQGQGQVAARWFHCVALAPGVPGAAQEEHARGVPEYLTTSANTEELLGRPAPTITDGVIGGVRGDGHGSTARGC